MTMYQTYPDDDVGRKVIRLCPYCGSRNVKPVEHTAPKGKKKLTTYICPTCGENGAKYWH